STNGAQIDGPALFAEDRSAIRVRIERRMASARPISGFLRKAAKAPVVSMTAAVDSTGQYANAAFVDRFLITAKILQKHTFIMQHACIIHVAGALLPADQTFELLRQRQPFRVASALFGFVHWRDKRVDGVTALSQGPFDRRKMRLPLEKALIVGRYLPAVHHDEIQIAK